MKKTVRTLTAMGAIAGGAALMAAPAGAHVSPDKDEVPAGSFNSVTLSVGHGCEESPTRQLVVQIPEGINSVTPQVHPGWTIEKVSEQLSPPIDDGEGGQLTERVSEVVFTAEAGKELLDGYRDTFTLGFRTPDTPGEYLFFKSVQKCVVGETAWIEEYTGEGEEPEHPSPVMLISEAEEEEGESTDTTVPEDEAADDETAAASDESEDDDSDSATGLAVAGLAVGALGLATGGVALARTRKQPTS